MKSLAENLFFTSLSVLLFWNITAYAQNPPVDEEIISVDTLLLNVPVIVENRNGNYVGGLKKENFYITENGVKRPVDFFADDSAPINVAIMIDTSGSTLSVMEEIKDAARNFLQVLRPEDKALIASFSTQTVIWSNFTSDQKELSKAVNKISGTGGSNLYDGMYLIIKKYFAPLKDRKAIIVLTDGMVGGLGVSEPVLLQALSESDIIIYPLLFTPNFPAAVSNQRAQYFAETKQEGAERMSRISRISGGKTVDSAKTDLKTAFQQIADELKKQYVIGFYPANEKSVKNFKVGLQLDPKFFNLQNIILRTKSVVRFKSKGARKKL